MITAEKIRSENKLVINFCDSCINQQSLCWVDDHSTRCADCAEFERTKQKCDVNKSNFKLIFNQSIFFVSSSISFKTMSIATSFKKRLIWFRESLMKINWRINQNTIFTTLFSLSKISRSCRFSSFSFFKISYSCSSRSSLVIICCICREIFSVIDRFVCCVLDCLVFTFSTVLSVALSTVLFVVFSTSALIMTSNNISQSSTSFFSFFSYSMSMYASYFLSFVFHQSLNIHHDVNERLKKMKYQMNDQQTINFATILRLKSRIVELKIRLNKMTELKERLLKMKNHINSQDETIKNIAVHVNANISEICRRIKTMKNNIERMNWRMMHDELFRSIETNDNEYNVYQHLDEIIEWLSRDFSILTRE